MEPQVPTGPIIAHKGKKKNVANIHDVNTEKSKKFKSVFYYGFNILIVIKNCPICRKEVSDESVIENPAANVVNAAINTAEPTLETDSVTRVARST
jgi:hypothetical protein